MRILTVNYEDPDGKLDGIGSKVSDWTQRQFRPKLD